MATRGSREKTIPVSIDLPEALHGWLAHVAHQKGLTVGEHIRAWIIASLEPWEGEPLPLDATEVVEIADAPAPNVPACIVSPQSGPRREDFATVEAFLKAERAERQARGAATRKRNREAKPKVIPEHLLRIAEARKQYPTMPLKQFSQILFDQDIYRANKYGARDPHPVDCRTLSMWLRKLRDAGVLSEH